MRICLAFVLLFGGQAFAQNNMAAWFPTQVGDKWTYEHETRENNGGGQANPEIKRWTAEQTITEIQTIPEGTLVAVATTPRRNHAASAYLIRGDCVFVLRAGEGELSGSRITPAFREGLAAGQISPNFCFPLTADKTWGALPDGKNWQVKGGPAGQNTFHVVSIKPPSSGMTVEIWFQQGVGIVREEDIHHGTISEERVRLTGFKPASPP